jgi:hypothetical protein
MDTQTASKNRPKRMHAVYRFDQRGEAPSGFVSSEEAQYLLDCRLAFWGARRKLILKKTEGRIKLRDLSCSISAKVADAALMGSEHHRALIESWAR